MNGIMLPRPRFWAEAGEQIQRPKTMLGEMLTFLLLYFLSAILQGIIMSIPSSIWMLSEGGSSLLEAVQKGNSLETAVIQMMGALPDWILVVTLFTYGVTGLVAVVYCRKFQGRTLASMGLRGRGTGAFGLGWLIGLGLFLGVLAIGGAVGAFRVGGLRTQELVLVLLACLGCAVQGSAEELLLRGYLQPSLGAVYPVPITLVLTALASTMLQGGSLLSLSTLNALLLGLFLCVWVIKRGELWSACAIHGAWLFAQNFLFGFAPQGQEATLCLVGVEVDAYRSALTGGLYGPTASLGATIILLAAIAVALALKPRDPAPLILKDEPEQNNL